MKLKELITRFNTDETHIEVDVVNQKDNGMSDDASLYSYTVLLVLNDDRYNIFAETSIDVFDNNEIKHTIEYFENELKKGGD